MGETDIETAIRETKEEVGLDAKIIDFNPIKDGYLVHGGTTYKTILLFMAEPLTGELKPQEDEVEQIKWTQIAKAGKYFTDYHNEAWREFLKRLHKA